MAERVVVRDLASVAELSGEIETAATHGRLDHVRVRLAHLHAELGVVTGVLEEMAS
jgi:hypothetical protein